MTIHKEFSVGSGEFLKISVLCSCRHDSGLADRTQGLIGGRGIAQSARIPKHLRDNAERCEGKQ